MPIHFRIPVCVAFAAIAVTSTMSAQRFQEPTREELQMTADPKAPGAPAVYLNLDESTDNRNHYSSRHARIKVLTEAGKEWATVEVPYVPGYSSPPIIEARTIHPDGTVIPLQGKAENLLVFKSTKAHVKAAVFNMPSVEVGSILEYKWTIPMGGGKVSGVAGGEGEENYYSSALAGSMDVHWDVQQDLFVHKAHYYYNPLTDLDSNVLGTQITRWVDGERASYLLFTQRLPGTARVTESPKHDFTLDIQDVPGFRHVSDAPPESAFRYRVDFYYTPYSTAKDYWTSESKRWSKSLEEYAQQSAAIRGAAAELTASATTAEAKARKLYDAVQAMDNTDFTRAKTESERKQQHLPSELKHAEDVLREKAGSPNDIAALYLALVRAAGLQADGMKVASRDERIFDPNFLSLGQLDALLVVLHLDGKDIYLDPGQRFCPFGQLHWTHNMAGGLQEGQAGPAYTPPNLSKDAITAHAADLTLAADGSVSGTVKILISGPAATNWRQLTLRAGTDELKQQFAAAVRSLLPQGMNVSVDKFDGVDTSNGYFSAIVKISGPLGSPAGKRMTLPAFLFSNATPLFVADEKRESPVDLKFAEQVIDDVVFHLPAGFTIQSAPAPAQLPWPDRAALVVKSQTSPGTIDIKRIFARAFVLLDPKEYPILRDYYQKVAQSDQQPLVLTTENSSTGN